MKYIIDRKTNEKKACDESKSQAFLYRHFLGRVILKIITRPFLSKLVGFYMNLRISKRMIKKFVKKNNINLDDYEVDKVKCYNDFFTRKIKDGKRQISNEGLIAPCDSKLSVYKIDDRSIFKIKNSYYNVKDLIKNDQIAKEYINGYALVFRLTVDDYHRYCYIDNGTKSDNVHIKGIFHTVNPIALERYNFYKTNAREYTILHTNRFSDVIHVEIGALCVGKIDNYHGKNYSFALGEEKGKFLFGGSTIVLLFKENTITIDEDILKNSCEGNETRVLYGERIGFEYERESEELL